MRVSFRKTAIEQSQFYDVCSHVAAQTDGPHLRGQIANEKGSPAHYKSDPNGAPEGTDSKILIHLDFRILLYLDFKILFDLDFRILS